MHPVITTTGVICKNEEDGVCVSNSNRCYVQRRLVKSTGIRVSRGCLDSGYGFDESAVTLFCSRNEAADKVRCCSTDYCNANKSLDLILDTELPVTVTSETTPLTTPPFNCSKYLFYISLPAIGALIFALVFAMSCGLARKKCLSRLKVVDSSLHGASSVHFESTNI